MKSTAYTKQEALLKEQDKPADPEEIFQSADENVTDSTENDESDDIQEDKEQETEDPSPYHHELTTANTHHSEIHHVLTTTSSARYTRERFDIEQGLSAEKVKSTVIAPTKTSDGIILVDWYTNDDSANPQNWPASKKGLILLQLCLYSFAAYGASSMYVPGEEGVMEQFNIGITPAALGLAIYVVGYGTGPLLWAPLSEIAVIGRNWVYVPTLFLFVILSIPTAVVDNYAGLLVLRFLTGFFGSPCLSNGGATIGDMVSYTGCYQIPLLLTRNSILSWKCQSICHHGRQHVSWVQQSDPSWPVLRYKQKAGDGVFGKSCG